MALNVEWTDFAEKQLKDIFNYYTHVADERIARRLVNKIVVRTDILESYPQIGSCEELLINYQDEFRYLIQDNYKIIYRVEKERVVIVSVFDCRQNPKKLGEFIRR